MIQGRLSVVFYLLGAVVSFFFWCSNVGALIIGVGFWAPSWYKYDEEPEGRISVSI